MFAAEEGSFLLQAVTNDMGGAMLAGWRQRMDRALEAIEGVSVAILSYLKGLVVNGLGILNA